MNGGVCWYVTDEVALVPAVIDVCAAENITLEHHESGRITYLSAELGHEGDQIEVTRQELCDVLARHLQHRERFTFQFWADAVSDLVCGASRVPAWSAYLFEFSFDGFPPDEANDVAARLHRARLSLGAKTVLWVEDRVGMTLEFGEPHVWNGTHAPAWPPR